MEELLLHFVRDVDVDKISILFSVQQSSEVKSG